MSSKILFKPTNAASMLLLALVFLSTQFARAVDNPGPGARRDSENSAGAKAVKTGNVTEAKQESADEQAPASGQEASSDGRHEGIKVHGHWTIEVRNPDGTVVTHREFENSLVQVGGGYLAILLSREQTAGPWKVFFGGGSSGLCGNNGVCTVGENYYQNDDSENLVVTGPAIPPSTSFTFSMTGSVKVPDAGTVKEVSTYLGTCPADVAPSACAAKGSLNVLAPHQFSGTTLSSPVSVAAGQTVQITVVFSFS